MKKFLLGSTVIMFSAIAIAQPVELKPIPPEQITEELPAPTVYQKQTVVQYNVPTCENCKTTKTVKQVVKAPVKPVKQVVIRAEEPTPPQPPKTVVRSQNVKTNTATYSSYTKNSSYTAQNQQKKSPVYKKPAYAVGNPLFFTKKGEFVSDTAVGTFVVPKGGLKKEHDPETGELIQNGRWYQWQVAERIFYGITDWLSFKLQGGYMSYRPDTKQYKASEEYDGAVPHKRSFDNTFGLQAHALDFAYLDMVIGTDFTWGKATDKKGSEENSARYKFLTPYALLGIRMGFLTPYIQASYNRFIGTTKAVKQDSYQLQPGVYIQPSKYFAIHPYLSKIEHDRPQWNLALDGYPYQNVMVGVEGTAVSLDKHPMRMYGFSARLKVKF